MSRINVENATVGAWYLTRENGFEVRIVGPDDGGQGVKVETRSGRAHVMEHGSTLLEIDGAGGATGAAVVDVFANIAQIVAAKNRDQLAEALKALTDADLQAVLSRHPVLWVIGMHRDEMKRRAADADPSQAFGPRESVAIALSTVLCAACGQDVSAEEQGGRWIVQTHPGASDPVCIGSGRPVVVATGASPEPAARRVDQVAQIRDLDTIEAINLFRLALIAAGPLSETMGGEIGEQVRHLNAGADVALAARGGDVDAIKRLATWAWLPGQAREARPGVVRALSAEAAWAAAEVDRIAEEAAVDIARDRAAVLREEKHTGPDPERVARAVEAGDPKLAARVEALLSGVRGCRDAARIERDPQVVQVALEREQGAHAPRPTVVSILEARLASLNGETRRNVKAREADAGEPREAEAPPVGEKGPCEAPADPGGVVAPVDVPEAPTDAGTAQPDTDAALPGESATSENERKAWAPLGAVLAGALSGIRLAEVGEVVPDGTQLGLVVAGGVDQLWAVPPLGPRVFVGDNRNPGLRPILQDLRVQAMKPAAAPPPKPDPERVPVPALPANPSTASTVDQLVAPLRDALAAFKAAGLHVSITVSTDGGVK